MPEIYCTEGKVDMRAVCNVIGGQIMRSSGETKSRLE